MGIVIGYIIASILMGAVWNICNEKFWGGLLSSLFLTPVISIILLIVFRLTNGFRK